MIKRDVLDWESERQEKKKYGNKNKEILKEFLDFSEYCE